jgi:hypothetical protein
LQLSDEQLKVWLQKDGLQRLDKVLLVLTTSTKPMSAGEIKAKAGFVGCNMEKWSISDVLARGKGSALQVQGGHELGSGLIDPEDECCCEGNCRQECVSASIISGVDAPPVLETSKGVLDLVALPVEDRIVAVLDAVLGVGWDAWRDVPLDQSLAEGGRAVGPVGEQEARRRQMFKDGSSGLVIVGLALAQMQQ